MRDWLANKLVTCLRAFALALFFSVGASHAEEALPRIISLDYCADQFVLALADRDQIQALSKGSDDEYSFYRDRALGIPQIAGTLDEVLYHQPDIVVQTWGMSSRVESLLNKTGIKMVGADYGTDHEVTYKNVLRVGTAINQTDRASEFVQSYQKRLQDLTKLSPLGARAAYVTPSGYTSGTETYVEDILKVAGFESWAASRNISGWQMIPMEDLVLDPPDVFITGFYDTSLEGQSNWSMARHGFLHEALEKIPTINIPGKYLACSGLFLVDAAEMIRQDFETTSSSLLLMRSPDE